MRLTIIKSLLGMLILMGVSCSFSSRNSSDTNPMPSAETTTVDYAEDAVDVTPVLTGTQIPDVTVRNIDGDTVKLRNLVREKPTILIFYRGG